VDRAFYTLLDKKYYKQLTKIFSIFTQLQFDLDQKANTMFSNSNFYLAHQVNSIPSVRFNQ